MKHKFEHPAPSARELNGPRYWRSLDELADTPGFREHLKREFPQGAAEIDGVDRRNFLRIMAASFALGGLGMAGCRRPEMNILPYGKSVEGLTPGLAKYYATAMPTRGGAIPLLAETHQGRPTKLEGNPSYAPYGGATDLAAQAAVLDLYDPDRAMVSTQAGNEVTAAQVNDQLAKIRDTYLPIGGAGLAFLAEPSSSTTRAALVADLKTKFPKALWAEYDPIDLQAPERALAGVFGRNVRAQLRLADAKRVLSLDCDFLQAEPGAIGHSRAWAKGRRHVDAGEEMIRLYVAESHFSITGSNADHRLRLASSQIPAFAAALAARVFAKIGRFGELGGALEKLAGGLAVDAAWLDACAADLCEHPGAALVCAGSHQSPAVHALAAAMNEALGAVGKTVEYVSVDAAAAATIGDLAQAIRNGQVRSLVIVGGNPAYNAPAELAWSELQKQVAEVVRHGLYADETSAVVTGQGGWHVHGTHFLESWGDARTADGTIVPVQPMILPLFGGVSEVEFLARIAGDSVTEGYSLVHRTVSTLVGGDEKRFRQWLHDGVLPDSAFAPAGASVRAGAVAEQLRNANVVVPSAKSLEARFIADLKVGDGAAANNGWLQECPDPITKISWDNPVQISPRLAAELGLVDAKRLDKEQPASGALDPARHDFNEFVIGKQSAPVAKITLDGRSVEAPVHIQPGLADYTIVLPLGYGRTTAGRVGDGVGFSAYTIRTATGAAFATGVTLEIIPGRTHKLPNTQEHWAIEGRDIFREANIAEHRENPAWAAGIGMESHSPAIYGPDKDMSPADKAKFTPRGNSLYEHPDFAGPAAVQDGVHQWGMSIDLNTCIGCNACVVACQAENNIPIVGRDQVLRGREMHWIRIDRYYSSGSENNAAIPEDPQVALQPMTCQHCESAPCESVCPVNATVHDQEGLNVMAYNRCIGTRYCANNCPYKVRRFNFFDYQQRQLDSLYMGPLGPQGKPELLKMAMNPDVTVRMRGVMEKCTYCVQRIQRAKIEQKVKAGTTGDIQIPDRTIRVACEQACPTEAIVFGNILDSQSAVSVSKQDPRTYAVLGYLNVRPRTSYIGRVRNPNPAMPGYQELPLSRLEYNHKNHPAAHGEAHGATHASPPHGETAPAHGHGGQH
ncbi:MAG TPA: TAT-variant-translocated molybdopterin oxidoreductase [Opitutaceae bacterium]|nr:TAT-variant-translocated molybdopterin oxidoreductase [Opitutaceae bacterium]